MSSRLWKALKRGTLPRDLLVCGPAGTGKTYSILKVLHCLCRDNQNLRIAICRETRAALTDSVLVTYEQEVLPLDGMEWMAAGVKRRVRQNYEYPSGSEIVLGSMENAERLLSTAWDIVFVNEAVKVSVESWETLGSRLRRPGRSSRFGYLLGDTNPGHPEHWLKKRCDEGKTVLWGTRHQANPALHDGNDWTQSGRDYLDSLARTLTGTRKLRYLDGEWAVGEGLWFEMFDSIEGGRHVRKEAAYDPALPFYLAVDPGVRAAAVLFQTRDIEIGKDRHGEPLFARAANFFADYLTENNGAARDAEALARYCREKFGRLPHVSYCDPAGKARTTIGVTVIDEYAKHDLYLQPWDTTNPRVSDSLANVEALLNPLGIDPLLTIHPSCRHIKSAFLTYKRKMRANQWMDEPEDPQHPAEDVIDALRGGLWARVRNVVDRLTLREQKNAA